MTTEKRIEGRHAISRRAALKTILAGSAAPFVMQSAAFAAACNSVVRIGAIVAPDSLNPFATWSSFWPTVFTYDSLVGVDALRHSGRKGFAKEWSVADDDLTWTFKIWPGMKWSDGQPATARDAAFTFNYLKGSLGKPDELNVGYNNTDSLDNAQSISALDDETLQIVTKTPSRWPIDNWTMIVPEHIWKDISYADARSTFHNDPPLVASGPMIIVEFQQGQFARFAPNKYFRTGQPKTSGMVFNFFTSADPIAQGLKSGNLDFGIGLTVAQWENLAKDPEIIVGESPIEQRDLLMFNTASGKGAGSTKALQDPAFRDAIGYAIDLKVIVDRAYRGHAAVGAGIVMPVATDFYSDLSDIRRHFDPKEAARRLDAAGYPESNGVRKDKDGKDLQLELITGTLSGKYETPLAAVQLISGWLGKVGIPVSVTQLDAGALSARLSAPAKGGEGWDLAVAQSWPSPDPKTVLNIGQTGGHYNQASWSDERFDKIYSEVQGTVKLERLKELVDEASRIIYTQAPYIVLAYPFALDARRKDCFKGWGPNDDMISQWSYFPFDGLEPV
ncbi:peptide ABC transporter substrate-binding protein [Mesorhizobium sp. L-8-10]|uniref:ABC transporter substrate-binding protein n=1 Tax=Mesorhizobium sp. L-8-10 TaxID=2744523 RepID=UPI001925666E|nr:ABC transporter substrate-binding protein [Mesorhizobium sp. L-8-10]BCH34953.1 peptide ABC transporter substrate-binding protein [Mesorhizobium sp. L-8-10]